MHCLFILASHVTVKVIRELTVKLFLFFFLSYTFQQYLRYMYLKTITITQYQYCNPKNALLSLYFSSVEYYCLNLIHDLNIP